MVKLFPPNPGPTLVAVPKKLLLLLVVAVPKKLPLLLVTAPKVAVLAVSRAHSEGPQVSQAP